MASRISHQMAKLGCAREWGGWGRLSGDGPGQHNPDRSEGPWGRAGGSARTEVPNRASSLTQGREYTVKAVGTKDGDIRAESVKRVASAVGEGSMVVQFVHKVLAE
jgi:hypothetical protein